MIHRAATKAQNLNTSIRSTRRTLLTEAFDDDATTQEQRVRIFVLILMSGTFSPDRGSRVLLHYLSSLCILQLIGTYD